MINIRFCGAAGEVTGSGYLVETPEARVLVDLGVFQGDENARARSRSLGPVDPRHLDAVVLSHAHIDHSGRLPLLAANGWRGKLHATHATLALTEILLNDLARLEVEDVERANRKRRRAGQKLLDPLYTLDDVARLHAHAKPLAQGQRREIAPGIVARLFEAGHIMGASSVELTVRHGEEKRILVFSGDIGPCGAPILRDPERPRHADLVVMESTYGDRDHPPREETVEAFKRLLEGAVQNGERVIIPSFAVGRTQVILYYLAEAIREGRLPRDFPIYLDSPMATAATEALVEHPEVYDEEARELARNRQIRSDLGRALRIIESSQESRTLNESDHACIILSASGMCEGGRVVHHLRHNLWRPSVHVLLVGYMAEGTLGRQLADGAGSVQILGEDVIVQARVHRLNGFSAHAGRTELLDWLGEVAADRPRLVLTHGEEAARTALRDAIRARYGLEPALPAIDDVIRVD
jgi:metallo-beta-lactamase family protein